MESFKLQVAGNKLQVSGFPPEAGPPLAEKLAACGLQLEACSRFQGTGFRANRFPFCRGGVSPPYGFPLNDDKGRGNPAPTKIY